VVGAFDFEAFAIVDAAGDLEDQGVVEEVVAGEAKAVGAVGLDKMQLLFHFLIKSSNRLSLLRKGKTFYLEHNHYNLL
jgi:hypothetical protein